MARLLSERKSGKIYEGYPWNYYEVTLPELTPDEKKFFEFIDYVLNKNPAPDEIEKIYLKDSKKGLLAELIKKLAQDLEPFARKDMTKEDERKVHEVIRRFLEESEKRIEHPASLEYLIASETIGMGKIQRLLEDDDLEEIMVNSRDEVFVFDRKHGLCKTNVRFSSDDDLMGVVKRAAAYVGKKAGRLDPLIDARLPDGSRVNITLPPVSSSGPTMTIRKFRKNPYTITQLIANGTIPSSLAAFLWLHVEGLRIYPMSMLIAGGTSSGKTTTLNALSVFIPLSERIITLEDTLELNFYNRENWIRLEARRGVLEKEISMSDLLKNVLRMRPDRIIVGEVRGAEALTMFNAMNTGHQGMMGTLHANTARETVTRLSDPPMNVPTQMFRLLDLIVVQQRMYDPNSRGLRRRIVEVAESSVMGGTVSLEEIFKWDPEGQVLERTALPSRNLEKIAKFSGRTKKQVMKELGDRKRLLDVLVKNKVFDYLDLVKVINQYYRDKKGVISSLSSG